MFKPTIAIDFDGVIHSYELGWHDGTIYGTPIENCFTSIAKLLETFNVFILSSRPADQILEWLSNNSEMYFEEIPDDIKHWEKEGVIGVTNKKLAAVAYIDDRGIPFTSWDKIIEISSLLNIDNNFKVEIDTMFKKHENKEEERSQNVINIFESNDSSIIL